jgi:hypothetical protein
MQINTQTVKKRKLVIVTSVIVAALLLAGALFYKFYLQPSSLSRQSNTPSQPTKEELKQQATEDAKNKATFLNQQRDNQDNPQPHQQPSPSSTDISLTAQTVKDSVIVRVEVGNFSSGTCNLTVTNNDKSTSQSANILYQPQTSTCAGFSVPISKVGIGAWSITVKVDTQDSSVSKSKTITYNVGD